MKKILLSFILLFSINIYAQITLEHVHVIATGRQYTEATDNASHKHAGSGASKMWDYSKLKASSKDSIRFGMPFWYKGHTHFPQSNYALISSNDTSVVQFAELTNSAFFSHGYYASSDTSETIYRLKSKLFAFPSTYNSTFNESLIYPGLSIGLGFDPDSTGPIPKIDSMQISTGFDRKATMDGWGTLKTPLGSFNSLKQTTLQVARQIVFVKTNGAWINASPAILNLFGITLPAPDSSYSVEFMTNSGGIGVPLMSYSYLPKDTSITDIIWLYAIPRKSSILSVLDETANVYPNPANDMITIQSETAVSFEVYNQFGALILSDKVQKDTPVNIENLSTGVYFIQLKNINQELVHAQKLLIN
jgi:hypothetical protein